MKVLPLLGDIMTIKQFLKKYVPKTHRLEAEEMMDEMLMDEQERSYAEGVSDARIRLRGVINEMRSW